MWWSPNEASNSIGNLVLHLCGNVTQWIIGGVGEEPFERHRQREFDERTQIPAGELLRRLRAGSGGRAVIGGLDGDALLPAVRSRATTSGYWRLSITSSNTSACTRARIILLSKARTGEDMRLWEPPGAASA